MRVGQSCAPILFLISLSMSVSGLITRAMEKEYTAVLGKLFKPVVRLAPRHSTTTPTVSDLFAARKKVFSGIYSNTNICGTCSIVHVAGTKGKGSAVEYISSSLIGNGHTVGIFTSPHMHTARERVRVNRDLIPHNDMIQLGNEVLEALSPQPWVVFFDLLLALAIKYFNEKNVKYMVLESGIGGRYDTTNFVDSPAACVITSISLDHQQLLGDTIEEIAYQKAGIIKQNAHVFTPATQAPSVLEVFRKECVKMEATLHEVPVGREYLADQRVHCETEVHVENACLSRAVLAHLQVAPTGWEKFYWPCRMERFNYRGSTVVLDGCHNGDSMERFLKGLRSTYQGKRILVLFGAGHEKCLIDMMDRLFAHADQVTMVQSKHFRAHTEIDLLRQVPEGRAHMLDAVHSEQLSAVQGDGAARRSLGERLQLTVESNDSQQVVIAVCGSLFAAAEAREHLFSQEPSLFSETDWVRQCDPDIPM